MMKPEEKGPDSPKRDDSRIILHFDYDCFYAAVFEKENPALEFVPLAVQQKQIIVTCNYTARRQGLRKLQSLSEAKRICPDVVIVVGEELGRFRDASKTLYDFLRSFSWNGKVERLGFDEVFLDVTDIIEFNKDCLNPHELENSFFHLDRQDPTVGFSFNALTVAGHSFPELPRNLISSSSARASEESLLQRLILGSHLAQHIRFRLENETGYTSTVGISTNKLLSKLVGNLNKPKAQTTLLPPYNVPQSTDISCQSNVIKFIDSHDIDLVTGIGFKTSQRIQNYILSRLPESDTGLVEEEAEKKLSVRDVRLFPGMCSRVLENILGGSGAIRGVGSKFWGLINGVDNSIVQQARNFPTQISLENTYLRLNTIQDVIKELRELATNLLNRMYVDLLQNAEDFEDSTKKKWIARPRMVRISTRSRHASNSDGSRRSFSRVSKSCPLPNFIFDLRIDKNFKVEKLIRETLIPLFKRLHSDHYGWNLCLINICVTNMVEAANEDDKIARDMFQISRKRDHTLKTYQKLEDHDDKFQGDQIASIDPVTKNDIDAPIADDQSLCHNLWEESEDEIDYRDTCAKCGAAMPAFAMIAHERFHSEEQIKLTQEKQGNLD
ncbi:DNA polymerase iota [Golovinomyces cichoracearum]|uniref:DNA polymerase iota n=1 Tax=Golovinomyces cichoracearum TaxID=62708 RepID=A0A420HQF7_9PEZI|nr:DNA polymerase iota [Golovinomyces cichoracearum]